MTKKLGLIGFGEAAHGIASGLREVHADLPIMAWDILFSSADIGRTLHAKADLIDVAVATGPGDIFENADIVLSAVTTNQSLVAAEQCAQFISPGVVFIDLNSTSPGKKRAVGEIIKSAGGHMVEAAVMDDVPRHGHRVPMLLAGSKAQTAAKWLTELGMQTTAIDGGIGQASTIKMVRSVFMKGLSAILVECVIAADRAGIQNDVLNSIEKTFPGIDWHQLTARSLTSTALHAGRRAGEMLECATTLKELDINPIMTAATAERLQELADLGLKGIAERSGTTSIEGFLENVKAVVMTTDS